MRVLTVLEMLQLKGRVTAAELAARLEVSTRTVQRYVARLQDLGVPVTSTRGRGAGYRLPPSYRLPPLPLNEDEAFVVALGLHALRHIGVTAPASTATGAASKLERRLPTDSWQHSQGLNRAVHHEATPWVAPIDARLIAEIASAIDARHELELTYRDAAGTPSERTVRPYGLLRSDDVWYLAAYCRWRRDDRLFRVDRVETARRIRTAFEAPQDFDVQEFVQRRLANVPARWTCDVWLETTLATLRYDLLPPRPSLEEERGGVVLRCGVSDLETYAARLLELGCPFEVRSPPELARAFERVAERARAIYDRHEAMRVT